MKRPSEMSVPSKELEIPPGPFCAGNAFEDFFETFLCGGEGRRRAQMSVLQWGYFHGHGKAVCIVHARVDARWEEKEDEQDMDEAGRR